MVNIVEKCNEKNKYGKKRHQISKYVHFLVQNICIDYSSF